MLATATSATLVGVNGHVVTVEVHLSNGLPSFTIVGLPDAACREARDRVRAAVMTAGLEWPKHRVTVNLAPSGAAQGRRGARSCDGCRCAGGHRTGAVVIPARQSIPGGAGPRRHNSARGRRASAGRCAQRPRGDRAARGVSRCGRSGAPRRSMRSERWASWLRCSPARRHGPIRHRTLRLSAECADRTSAMSSASPWHDGPSRSQPREDTTF